MSINEIDRKLINPFSNKIIVFFTKVYIYLINLGRNKKYFVINHPRSLHNVSVYPGRLLEYWINFCREHFVLEYLQCPKGDNFWYPKVYSNGKGKGFKVRFNKIKWL